MRCLLLVFVLLGGLSCSKDTPPTAPAGKSTGDDLADLFDLFDALPEADEDTAVDSTASSAPDSSSSDSTLSSAPDSSVFSPTAAVAIPDAALRRYLEKVLKKRRGATITHADMRKIVNLLETPNFEGINWNVPIKSLVGLEAATNLQNVSMGGYISDLTPLANLDSLRYLYLRGNLISDLTPLTNLPKLRYLNLKGNSPLNDVSLNEHVPALRRRGVEVLLSPYERTFPDSPFDIELVFVDDFTEAEQEVWHRIARRWESAIQMDFPDYTFSDTWSSSASVVIPIGEQIDDLRIYITRFNSNRLLGTGAPLLLRSSSMPILGHIEISQLVSTLPELWEVGLHEIGHVLGIGSLWDGGGLIRNRGTADAHFAGSQAIAAFDQAGGSDYQSPKVPTDRDVAHWHRSVLSDELMSTSPRNNILSAITLGALSDLGYTVDFSAADPYELPPFGAAKPVADAVPFCSLEGLPPPVYVDD